MKIVRLSTFLDFGGLESRLVNISLVQDNNQWIFICMNRSGWAAEMIRKNGKQVIDLGTKPSVFSVKTFLKVYKALKEVKPDVVHTSGAEANFHGILAAKLAGVPLIIGEEIGFPNHSKRAQIIFSRIYDYADYIVGNSTIVLDAVKRLEKVDEKKLIKIWNPVIFKDLDAYKKGSAAPNCFKLLMYSRLEPVKNIEGILNVVNRCKRETSYKLNLVIAGAGSSEQQLKERVSDLHLGAEVNFVGFIGDPYPYLVNADLYVLNSFSEGFSNSLVEAMYSKTLSLSTDVGAAPEIIQDGVNGFLVPVNDENILFEKICSIMQMSAEKRSEIGEKGHQTVVENFSLKIHIEALMKLYNPQQC